MRTLAVGYINAHLTLLDSGEVRVGRTWVSSALDPQGEHYSRDSGPPRVENRHFCHVPFWPSDKTWPPDHVSDYILSGFSQLNGGADV